MQILVNTDHNIPGVEALADHVRAVVSTRLGRFADSITRVEVHLSDEAGAREGPEDLRCMMEARIEGLRAHAVTHHAPTVHQAIEGAVDKLERAVDTTLERAREVRA